MVVVVVVIIVVVGVVVVHGPGAAEGDSKSIAFYRFYAQERIDGPEMAAERTQSEKIGGK